MDFAKNIGETQSHEDNTFRIIVTIINQNHYNQQNDYIEIIYLFYCNITLYNTKNTETVMDTRVIQSLPQCMPAYSQAECMT